MSEKAQQFNLGKVHEAIAAAVPERDCLIWRERHFSFAEITDRSRRLANFFHAAGLGTKRERTDPQTGETLLGGHESGQDHVGLYLYNSNAYIEGMLGAFKSRTAAFNINYRYVESELSYLLRDARPAALVFHCAFAPTLAKVLPTLDTSPLLVQVGDESGNDLLPGAVDYEEALAAADPTLPPVDPSPDDLYILYTGGTTGMPKGVLWRQHDIFIAAMGGRAIGSWQEAQSYEELARTASSNDPVRVMLLPPLMHGAAQWAGFIVMTGGGAIVLPDDPTRLDPPSVLRTIERERVQMVTVVGDAMARPLVEEIERAQDAGKRYDLSSLFVVGNGGAALSPGIKQRLLALKPGLVVSDTAGASETGAQMSHVSTGSQVATGTFLPGPGTAVLSEDLDRVLSPPKPGSDDAIGWLAQKGAVPLGYLGDAEKSKKTFPVIEGVRWSVPGDRARLGPDGTIILMGRDSVTINSGGEKIFAEEVEQALLNHAAVADVVVAGRPSERWGEEVVAVVQLADGVDPGPRTEQALLDEAARHLARYKLPKAFVFVPAVLRSPAGKADYRWAREQARSSVGS